MLTGKDLLTTGRSLATVAAAAPPMLLETSMPGVFAAGDVRHGSIKRVAAAVGEGSTAIQLVHEYLQITDDPLGADLALAAGAGLTQGARHPGAGPSLVR